MIFPVCLVFVLASFVISEVQATLCPNLDNCTTTMEYGTWSWLYLPSLPTQSSWNTTVNNICGNVSSRTQCSQSQDFSSCTNEEKKNNATAARLKTEFLCDTTGRSFLRRIYTEASQCIANRTKAELADSNRRTCRAEHEDTITTSTANTQQCNLVKRTRDCDRDYVGRMCGNLFRWMIDGMWEIRFNTFYTFCTLPTRFPFPT